MYMYMFVGCGCADVVRSSELWPCRLGCGTGAHIATAAGPDSSTNETCTALLRDLHRIGSDGTSSLMGSLMWCALSLGDDRRRAGRAGAGTPEPCLRQPPSSALAATQPPSPSTTRVVSIHATQFYSRTAPAYDPHHVPLLRPSRSARAIPARASAAPCPIRRLRCQDSLPSRPRCTHINSQETVPPLFQQRHVDLLPSPAWWCARRSGARSGRRWRSGPRARA